MSPEQRIAKLKKSIEATLEDIEWLKSSGFTISGSTNAELIEREEQYIEMLKDFIARLKEQIVSA